MRNRSGPGNVSPPQVTRTAAAHRAIRVAVATLTAAMLFIVGAVPAWGITVTFVRHGQSAGNAAGIIDTSVPGPELTELGRQEAAAVAEELYGAGNQNGYDAVYASSMIRTQQTAAPLADALDVDVVALPGFREISAGIFEGSSEKEGLGRIGYALSPFAWVLGLRSLPVLGSTDGNAFDARVDGALQTVYDSGAQKPVVFAHGATIMFWVMMNVDNPDLSLFFQRPLGNTAVVVVDGSPEQGWTLKSWDGVEVPAEADFATKLFVNVRDLVTAPQTSIYRIVKALETGDPGTIATAVLDGAVEIVTAPVKFVGAVARDIVDAAHSGGSEEPRLATTPTVAMTAATPEPKRATAVPDRAVTETETAEASDIADGRKSRSAKADSRDDRTKEALRDARDRVRTSLRDAGSVTNTHTGKTEPDDDRSSSEVTSADPTKAETDSDTTDERAA